jgi:hypothetical protein
MEGVGGSARFADRTAYRIRLRSDGMSEEVYAGQALWVPASVASLEFIRQYLAGGPASLFDRRFPSARFDDADDCGERQEDGAQGAVAC